MTRNAELWLAPDMGYPPVRIKITQGQWRLCRPAPAAAARPESLCESLLSLLRPRATPAKSPARPSTCGIREILIATQEEGSGASS